MLLPDKLDLSEAWEGGNAVIVPLDEDVPGFTLIGCGSDEEQNAIAREIVRRWNEFREPVVKDLFA